MGKRDQEPQKSPDSKASVANKWQRVVVLPIAVKEGKSFLAPGQYAHLVDEVKMLVGFGRRDFESELRIESFGDYWELKEKGGVLGKKNMRVYFAYEQNENEVVILMTDKKEQEGQANPHIKYILKNRLRLYRQGHFNGQLLFYSHPDTTKPNDT